MRGGDARGRCLAIIGDDLMNAHLSDVTYAIDALSVLEELGYGLMALPPTARPEPLRVEAVDQLLDQLQDYLRHGYAALVVESGPADTLLTRLDAACRARGVAPPPRLRPGPDFRASLEAVRAIKEASSAS